MTEVLSVVDLTDGLLLCLSAEPKDSEALALEFEVRTGCKLETRSVGTRLGHLIKKGLAVSIKPKGNYLSRQFSITPTGEEYADKLYEEYWR